MDAIQGTETENIKAKVQKLNWGVGTKCWSNSPQNRAKDREMEDWRETIKTSPGGQHWNLRVPARENRINVGKEMSQEIFQKNFTGLKNISFQVERVHWASTQWMKIDPDPGTSLKFHNLEAQKILKKFQREKQFLWRIKHQNGFRFLNSNTDNKRTVKQCFQNPDEKFIFNLEFYTQTLKWLYRIFVGVFRLARSWQFSPPRFSGNCWMSWPK